MRTPFIGTAKRVMRPIVKPWLNRVKAVRELRTLGVRDGGTLLVHSSLSSLGYVPGGTETIIGILRDAIGSNGTLVLPTHTWLQMNEGCRVFDSRYTPSCVGTLAEAFRRMPGVVRSLHPTHSVAALGHCAEELTQGHELAATPCGLGTPYARTLDRDGQILLLGVGLESNTMFHTIEADCKVEYLMQAQPDIFRIVDASGLARELQVRRHANGIHRRFPAMRSLLENRGVLREGHVGCADTLLLEGSAFREVMVDVLRINPIYLMATCTNDPA